MMPTIQYFAEVPAVEQWTATPPRICRYIITPPEVGPGTLFGTARGIGTCVGVLAGDDRIAGLVRGYGYATGGLTAYLDGWAEGKGRAAGVLLTEGDLAGLVQGYGYVTGGLTAYLDGWAEGKGTATATAIGSQAIAGTATGVGTATGNLLSESLLAGTAEGKGTATGNLVSELSGTATGVGTATGTFADPSVELSTTTLAPWGAPMANISTSGPAGFQFAFTPAFEGTFYYGFAQWPRVYGTRPVELFEGQLVNLFEHFTQVASPTPNMFIGFGPFSDQQPSGYNTITITVEGFSGNPVALNWNGAAQLYQVDNQSLGTYLISQVGNELGINISGS